MSKLSDIAKVLADKYNLTNKEAADFLDEFNNLISSALKTDRIVKIKGLGTFRVTKVSSRESVDVNTGERIVLEGRDKISFTPDATMRDLVNSPFAQFSTVILNEGVDFSDIDKKYDDNTADADMVADAPKAVDEKVDENVVDAEAASSDNEKLDVDSEDVTNEKLTVVETENQIPEIDEQSTATDEQFSDEHSDDVDVTDEPVSYDENDENDEDMSADDVAVVEIPSSDVLSGATTDVIANSTNVESDVDESDVDESVPACMQPTECDESQPLEIDKGNQVCDDTSDKGIPESNGDDVDGANEDAAHYDGMADSPETQNTVSAAFTDTVNDVVDTDDSGEGDEDARHDKQMKIVIALLSVFVLVSLAGVFYFYNQLQIRDHRIQHLEAQMKGLMPLEKDTSVIIQETVATTLTPDSITNIQKREMQKAESKKIEPQNTASTPEPKVVKEPQVAPVKDIPVKEPKAKAPSSEYDKDARVRTGAYEITGVDQTVTVKNGQTLKSISRFYLGEGMECYVEVLNGVKEVKTGDKLKIPKLKLKKRK